MCYKEVCSTHCKLFIASTLVHTRILALTRSHKLVFHKQESWGIQGNLGVTYPQSTLSARRVTSGCPPPPGIFLGKIQEKFMDLGTPKGTLRGPKKKIAPPARKNVGSGAKISLALKQSHVAPGWEKAQVHLTKNPCLHLRYVIGQVQCLTLHDNNAWLCAVGTLSIAR